MSIRDYRDDSSDHDQDSNGDQEHEQPLFGDELDRWGRPRPTEQGRDFPPEHSSIEICHRETADDEFTAFHPDELEINREAFITTGDDDAHFSITNCQ